MRWPGAQVTGIDVSATSVRCTEELKRKHNLNNLNVQPVGHRTVNELDASFDQIVCTGVLHHWPIRMQDYGPCAGCSNPKERCT